MVASELLNDSARHHPIPVLQARLTDDQELQFDDIGEPEWLTQQFIRSQYGIKPDRLREFRVSCDRMSPTIQTGDRVRAALVAHNLSPNELVEKQAYLMFGPDGVFATRVRRIAPNDGLILAGDNPESAAYSLEPAEWTDTYHPIARILEVIRPM